MKKTKREFKLIDLRRLAGAAGGLLASSEVVAEKIGAESFGK